MTRNSVKYPVSVLKETQTCFHGRNVTGHFRAHPWLLFVGTGSHTWRFTCDFKGLGYTPGFKDSQHFYMLALKIMPRKYNVKHDLRKFTENYRRITIF